MVKITRSPVPPASLAAEAQKEYGSYSKPDVIRQLREDFHEKCYICELRNLSDPEVEHLRPHHNRTRKERVFDWNNLFLACRHCNLVKSASVYEDKILDCCRTEPEKVLTHIYADFHVKIYGRAGDEKAQVTAELIEACFEKRDTGIREAACQHRIEKLSDDMNILYKTLQKYKNSSGSARYRKSLGQMLKRESQFAAFKRDYVREHLEDYPGLKEFVDI